VYATAVVEPETWAAIAPVQTGRIIEINFKERDKIAAGDVLARLDDADLQAQLEEAKALASLQETEFERAKKLVKNGTISQKLYDEREAALTQTQARIRMYEHQIRQLSLIAPVDGPVLWRDVELGEVKQAGEPLFWVGQPRPLRLEAEVDEEDIPKIKSGQRVLITADAFPGDVLDGTVDWISPKGDPINKSYRVYVSLPDETRLMIGMTVESNIIAQEKTEALLVPAEAVIEGPAVWEAVKEEGVVKAHITPVKTGIVGKEQVEILEGLEESDLIILPPFYGLSDDVEDVEIRMK
jgi:RND family efflux transporter MFP subunit